MSFHVSSATIPMMSLVPESPTAAVLAIRETVASSHATATTTGKHPVSSNETKVSIFHKHDLDLPPLSWFDSQASWPLALIPLAFAILLTIGITAVTGSRRERILGVSNPANEKVLKQLRDEHRMMREGKRYA
ncbi:hypothetical protein PG993_010964 [Apiospora rasikravindrae]|uniref:Uncharacterized protein n=1 Tax=Apiospora rasikravindrae TaxID=990691 RepID=A0ABR1SD11_9PEZI